ncbi:chemotaxis protein [Tupanvirus deep ocean]|uniref:Chemotaxis protein n=2 Tax=Tupanvirus TaxID=2094720 RepID=A0AC62A9F6_9VIRU|nr:chemotaxis protein [Tupanvirus deep ocean]QKU34302.1 chemotaxis protein [Tupanvirus deep ocean]
MSKQKLQEIVNKLLNKLKYEYKNVDRFSRKYPGTVATVFVHIEDDFIRISTTLKDSDGSEAVWTKLERSSLAYNTLIQGKTFIGEQELFGKKYFTMYEPEFRDDKHCVVSAVSVGIPLKKCKCTPKCIKCNN